VCAVLGRKIEGDEEIVAYVQPVEGQVVDVEDLLKYARGYLTGYKVPGRVVVRAQLPTAPSGKILKHQLAQELADQ
jgi:long-chain acyl-CoA synthetase